MLQIRLLHIFHIISAGLLYLIFTKIIIVTKVHCHQGFCDEPKAVAEISFIGSHEATGMIAI